MAYKLILFINDILTCLGPFPRCPPRVPRPRSLQPLRVPLFVTAKHLQDFITNGFFLKHFKELLYLFVDPAPAFQTRHDPLSVPVDGLLLEAGQLREVVPDGPDGSTRPTRPSRLGMPVAAAPIARTVPTTSLAPPSAPRPPPPRPRPLRSHPSGLSVTSYPSLCSRGAGADVGSV